MLLSTSTIILTGIAAVILLTWLATLIAKRMKKDASSAGCITFVIAVALTIGIFSICTSKAIVIENGQQHHTRYILGNYNGLKGSLGETYLINNRDDWLILYQVSYSESLYGGSAPTAEPEMFGPHSAESIKNTPDYYFYEPRSISVKQKRSEHTTSAKRWILDTYSAASEREEHERSRSRYPFRYAAPLKARQFDADIVFWDAFAKSG